ncbi:hypothetical protein Tco_0947018 [Tanacetum coccineum]
MFVDDDGNPLVPTGNLDSDSEVEVVFDETTNLMASTNFKGGSDRGYVMRMARQDREFHYLQGQLDEFPFSNMETLLDEVSGLYDGASNTQQEMEIMHARLVEARA